MPYGIANTRGVPSDQELAAILSIAREAGVVTIDTARAYGESERRIGEVLADSDSWRIVTKLSPTVDEAEGAAARVAAVELSVETSLRWLRRRKLDGLLLHRWRHRRADGGSVWRVLVGLRSGGLIGTLGVSCGSPAEAWQALDDDEVDIVQVASSLLDQRLYKGRFFETARERGKEVFVRSVLLQGVADLPPDGLPPGLVGLGPTLQWVRGRAAALGLRAVELWLLVAAAILDGTLVIGCESAEQVTHSLRTLRDHSLSVEIARSIAAEVPDLPEALLNPAMWLH